MDHGLKALHLCLIKHNVTKACEEWRYRCTRS